MTDIKALEALWWIRKDREIEMSLIMHAIRRRRNPPLLRKRRLLTTRAINCKEGYSRTVRRYIPPTSSNRTQCLLESFIVSAHSVVTINHRSLERDLHLPKSTLTDKHRLREWSEDMIRIIKAPPQPVDNRGLTIGQQTDFGSVTVLFNQLGGLQILPPGADAEWCYVKPRN